MALPLAYRPKTVIALIEEEKVENLKLTINKKEVFLSCMIEWYKNMSKRDRSTFTKKSLIRRAIFEAHRLQLPSASIPEDWIKTMTEKCGLICYISKRAKVRRAVREEVILESFGYAPKDVESEEAQRRERRKSFLDLTTEVPPEYWTEAKKRGISLPRYLGLYSDETSNILYWDYKTDHWKVNVK